MVVLADPNAPAVSSSSPSNSVALTNITVTPLSTHAAGAQFTSLQPVAVGHLTSAGGDRPLTLDNSILTVTFDAVSGSAVLHNRPGELGSEVAVVGGGAGGGIGAGATGGAGAVAPQPVTHFINLTTFVNPMGHPMENPSLAWRPMPAVEATGGSQGDPGGEAGHGESQEAAGGQATEQGQGGGVGQPSDQQQSGSGQQMYSY